MEKYHVKTLANDLLGLHDSDKEVFKARLLVYLGLVPSDEVSEKDPPSKSPRDSEEDSEEHSIEPRVTKNDRCKEFTMMNLKAGIGGSSVDMAIGRPGGKSGKSIVRLTDEDMEEARKLDVPVLTPAAAAVLKKKDPETYDDLKKKGLVE
jgi:hypothetical protein